MDSKWRWSLPWGVFSTGLLVLMVVATSLWNYEVLNTLSRYVGREFSLHFASESNETNSRSDFRWINSNQTIRAGARSVHFSRTLAYHRRFNAKPAPITVLYKRFSDVPWDE